MVTPDEVLIADYKTNRPAPNSLAETKKRYADYVRQLALYRAVLMRLYPGRPVRAALVWTDTPDLMEIPAAELDAASRYPHLRVTILDAAPGRPYVPASHLVILPDSNEVPMAVGKVSDANFEAEVLKATGPVVVDFWAEWCGPCRMIAPALEEIAGAMGDKVKIVKLNVDENPGIASKYGIMSIPTLMIFKNGEMASRQVGAAPKQKLEQWINTSV